jgi:hypothetical protein
LQKFSFQGKENFKITISPYRTVPDPEDLDHEDKMPKNTRACSATSKTSSQHSIQDWSDDNFDRDCHMYLNLTPLAYGLPVVPTSGIPNEEVVNAAPLNQGLPPSTRAGKKRGVQPQPDAADKSKRQKVGMPLHKKQRPFAAG